MFNLFLVVWKTFTDYASRTSIHGIQYLGDEEGHWFEKVFWIIVFVISLTGCSYLITETYTKWRDSPVIVSFDQQSTPIWKIPFPAVTICPEAKLQRNYLNISEIFKITRNSTIYNDEYLGIDDDDLKKLETLYQICDYHFEPNRFKLETTPRLDRDKCLEQLENLAVDQDETFSACRWRGKNMDCQNFTKIITEEGICYTFNMLDYRDIYHVEE